MDTERLINTLRDVIARRRVGLPMPAEVDLDELLEEAATELELLADGYRDDDDEHHCDGCTCDDDDDDKPVLAAAAALRERLVGSWKPAT